MSNMSQIEMLQALNALGEKQLDLQNFVDELAKQKAADSAHKIAEAKQIMGDDFEKHVPVSRQYYLNQREQMRLEHERRMLELEFRDREAKVRMNEAAAGLVQS